MKKKRPLLTAIIYLITFIGLFPIFINTATAQEIESIKLTINFSAEPLDEAIKKLEQQSKVKFAYDAEKLELSKYKSPKSAFTDSKLKDILSSLLSNTPIAYRELAKNILLYEKKPEKLQQRGRITGKILDEKGEALPGASIKVIENGNGLQTNVDGSYVLNLNPGTYTLELSYVSFKTKRVTDILVQEAKNTPLDISMKPDANGLKEVMVTASYKQASIEGLYARQRNNTAVSDGITAEQISRTPVNNTAQVLAKVSGIQLSNERNVVIRGLSDRYNNVLLNGAMVPSSEPNRRDFAFDMIPSALLDNIVVNKTATPDLTGEFAGGLVQVNMKEIPTEDFLQLTVGSGYNSRSTGKHILGLDHGNKAWLGLSSDVHKKPLGMTFGEYNSLIGSVKDLTPTPEQRKQLNTFLGSMPDNWRMKQYTAQPIQNYQFQAGKVLTFKNNSRLGIIAAATYRNEQRSEQKDLYRTNFLDYQGEQYKYLTTLGSSLNAGYTFGTHKITLQNTYNRKFSDDLWKYSGIDDDNSSTRVDNYNNVTVINSLLQSQLGGEHVVSKSGIKVDWIFSIANLDRDQPYSRLLTRANGDANSNFPKDYFTYPLGGNKIRDGSLFDSELHEKLYNWGTNLQFPFRAIGGNQLFKTGYQGKYRKADFNSNLYRVDSFSHDNYQGVPYYDVLNRDNFMSDLYLKPVSSSSTILTESESSEGYNGFQRLHSFYGMFDLKPLEKLRLIAGIRAEKNEQHVFDLIWNAQESAYVPKETILKQTDWLPSVNVVYSFTKKFNMRAAWYKTVARPDLRELSSFRYFDYDIFGIISGSELKTTKIENADLRFEYYPSPGEILSISGFYKNFKNPIEVVYLASSSGQQLYYNNLKGAKDLGLEVDFRKSLNFVSDRSFLRNLYISGNFTWLKASIDFDPLTAQDESGNPVPSKRNRPLAGQSPYILNGGLLYTSNHFGANITYNRFGKRIVYASSSRSIDEYENPRDMVDLQLSYKFLKQQKAEFRFNISNLLNQEQFIYVNQFNVNNPNSFLPGLTSVEAYPGTGEVFADHQLDPKGTSFNKDYDTKIRRNKSGTTYSLNFTYRF